MILHMLHTISYQSYAISYPLHTISYLLHAFSLRREGARHPLRSVFLVHVADAERPDAVADDELSRVEHVVRRSDERHARLHPRDHPDGASGRRGAFGSTACPGLGSGPGLGRGSNQGRGNVLRLCVLSDVRA